MLATIGIGLYGAGGLNYFETLIIGHTSRDQKHVQQSRTGMLYAHTYRTFYHSQSHQQQRVDFSGKEDGFHGRKDFH